jgi:hypothetical protein
MRSLLVVETSTRFMKKEKKAIYLSIVAKLLEGCFTLSLAYLTIMTSISGPLTLLNIAEKTFLPAGYYIFALILFCIFVYTMAPAMMVNAKQLSILTGFTLVPSLFFAGVLVWLLSFICYYNLLLLISIGTLSLILFIIFTVYNLHKHRLNKQK